MTGRTTAVGVSDSGSNTERLSLAVVNTIWNITRQRITERMIVSPDQAWSVSGPNTPPRPAETTQGPMIEEFKKEKENRQA